MTLAQNQSAGSVYLGNGSGAAAWNPNQVSETSHFVTAMLKGTSPDGRLNGREILLALYVHMAHHRGQAEVYLRIKGVAPPPYVF